MTLNNKYLENFSRLESDYLRVNETKPKIGYLCLRTPLEIIESFDAIPLRIIPREGFDTADYSTIRPDGCSFCRTIPAVLNTDYYAGLSAVIGGSCCDQQRRVMDTLSRDLNIPVILYGAPRTFDSDESYYLDEMTTAFSELASKLGRKLSPEKIIRRIIARNRLRILVNKLRAESRLPNSLLHRIAASPLPPEMITDSLQATDLPVMDSPVRLMLAGSVPGHWELELIESMSARVVADVTCLGDRVFHEIVSENGDPLKNLYDAYIENNLCPHRRPQNRLLDYIKTLAAARNIGGIVFLTLKYCHPWGLSAVRFKDALGYPMLRLDDDLTSPAPGNMRTRVGAFLEMLETGRHRKAAE